MKKQYMMPEAEAMLLRACDVITASNGLTIKGSGSASNDDLLDMEASW